MMFRRYWLLIAGGCLTLGLFLNLFQLFMTFAIEGVPLDPGSPSFQKSVAIHILYGLGIGLGFYLLFVQRERSVKLSDLEEGRDLRLLSLHVVLLTAVVVVGANLGALMDLFRHPEIPYWDEEHIVVGGATALLLLLVFGQLMRHTYRLRRALREQRRLELEARRFHSQLVHTEKLSAIGQLAGGVAHELNNPLQAIIAYASLNAEKAKALASRLHEPEMEGIARNAIALQEAAQRSAKIVRNLLAFARKDAQQKTTVDLGHVVRSTVEFLEHSLSMKNVRVETDLERALPPVSGNPVALQQVFTNLLLNARDAMPSGGTVAMSARRVDGHVEISVRDSGCGMGPDVKARLFEPFFTTKSPGEGTGLGLSVAYGIVKEHGGSIGVESEPGMGSTFTLRFLAMDHPGSPGAATPDSVPAPGGAA